MRNANADSNPVDVAERSADLRGHNIFLGSLQLKSLVAMHGGTLVRQSSCRRLSMALGFDPGKGFAMCFPENRRKPLVALSGAGRRKRPGIGVSRRMALATMAAPIPGATW